MVVIMVEQILMPAGIIGGLGLIFGLGLAFVSKKFEVRSDERVAKVREVLPGANCAACGYTGCDVFAEAVVEGKAEANGCPVGGVDTAAKLSEILGVELKIADRMVAHVMCGGNNNNSRSKYEYKGIADCTAAAALFAGPNSCAYGCLGMGNCQRVCDFNAIVISNGLAKVIPNNCTACGKCVSSCPKKIIKMVPETAKFAVNCCNLDKGSTVRLSCDVGCIGCGRCTKACEFGAITLKGTLAEIDTAKCTNCGECAKVCPTNCIIKQGDRHLV
jgi:Na+-translocating ferredoxin:NAD+ oxidoreductase RNF subunit RnfB